jgi:hypothetical protein
MTDHSTLERRLHDASDPALWDDVSPDAWQQNARRVAADRSHRAGRRLRVVAAAAAVVVVVGGGAFVASQLGRSSLAPSGGDSRNQDPFQKENRVGKTVVLERFSSEGSTVTHSAFLTRAGGKGLSLCDQYLFAGASSANANGSNSASVNGSGGCTAAEPASSGTAVNAFVLSTGSRGGDLTGITGAVDSRTASIKAWVSDSETALDVPLHALGIDGLQAFGITTVGKRAPVVRLAAYDAKGALMQVFEPGRVFGAGWLPGDHHCRKTVSASPLETPPFTAGPEENVDVAASSVLFSGTAGPHYLCVVTPQGKPISSGRQDHYVVVVTGPEVATIRYQIPGKPSRTVSPTHDKSTPWGFVSIFTGQSKRPVTLDPRGASGSVISVDDYYQAPTS